MRDGVHGVRWTPSYAPTEAEAKTSNLRSPMGSVHIKKPLKKGAFLYEKSARRDSNPRPRPWQGRAPPTEPLALMSDDKMYYSIQGAELSTVN